MDKIYIIEDDENIRNLLKIALEGFGYEAEGFETAEEGLERIKEDASGDGWCYSNPPDTPDRWSAGASHYAFNCQREGAG